MATYSRVRPSGFPNGCPCQPSTTWGPETPRPRSARPPESASSVMAVIAVIAGVRAAIWRIAVPRLDAVRHARRPTRAGRPRPSRRPPPSTPSGSRGAPRPARPGRRPARARPYIPAPSPSRILAPFSGRRRRSPPTNAAPTLARAPREVKAPRAARPARLDTSCARRPILRRHGSTGRQAEGRPITTVRSTRAQRGWPSELEFLMVAGAPPPPPTAPYSHAVRAGDFLFVTGQLPASPETGAARRRRDRRADPPGDAEPGDRAAGSRHRPRAGRLRARLPRQLRRLRRDERRLPELLRAGPPARDARASA